MKQYDVILYHETRLQKQICDFLIKNVYGGLNYLLIGREGNWVEIENSRYYFNFHFRITGLLSLFYLPFLNVKLSKLICNEFCASFIPAINSRILASLLKHKNKCNIEDGLGTFTSLHNPNDILESIPLGFANVIIGNSVKNSEQLIDGISRFYTIYGKSKYANLIIKDKVVELQLLEKKYPELTDEVYFVGQPLVERKMIGLDEYVDTVNSLAENYGALKYFYHPTEFLQYNLCEKVEVNRIESTLEEYIVNNKKPKIIISYVSTVLMSIKLLYPNIKCYYLDSDVANQKMRYILESFGVKRLDKSIWRR